jgi:hypothetical protein
MLDTISQLLDPATRYCTVYPVAPVLVHFTISELLDTVLLVSPLTDAHDSPFLHEEEKTREKIIAIARHNFEVVFIVMF